MTRTNEQRIVIGNCAGHHWWGQADLEVVYHCRRGLEFGYYHVRKRLVDRAAFNYDPTMGWERDCWFEWPRAEEER